VSPIVQTVQRGSRSSGHQDGNRGIAPDGPRGWSVIGREAIRRLRALPGAGLGPVCQIEPGKRPV